MGRTRGRALLGAVVLCPLGAWALLECSSEPVAKPAEKTGSTSLAITFACTPATEFAPCDPGDAGVLGGGECTGLCVIAADAAACVPVLPALNEGKTCGESAGQASDCTHSCRAGACVSQNAADGVPCDPSASSGSYCDGVCQAGACTAVDAGTGCNLLSDGGSFVDSGTGADAGGGSDGGGNAGGGGGSAGGGGGSAGGGGGSAGGGGGNAGGGGGNAGGGGGGTAGGGGGGAGNAGGGTGGGAHVDAGATAPANGYLEGGASCGVSPGALPAERYLAGGVFAAFAALASLRRRRRRTGC